MAEGPELRLLPKLHLPVARVVELEEIFQAARRVPNSIEVGAAVFPMRYCFC